MHRIAEFFKARHLSFMKKFKDLGTPSAGSEFKVDFRRLQELNYLFTRHADGKQKENMDSPYARAFKTVNKKLENKHWNAERIPVDCQRRLTGEREPRLCCWSGRRACLGLVSSAVPGPFLALRSSPHYKDRVLLALRGPGLFTPGKHCTAARRATANQSLLSVSLCSVISR